MILLLLAPIVVTSAAGFSLSTLYRSGRHLFPIVDLDGGDAARRLVSALGESPELDVLEVTPQEAKRLLGETPRAGAALVIPEGFTEAVTTRETATLELWSDPVKHLEVLKIRAAVERARGALVTAQVAARIAVVQVLSYAGEADFEALSRESAELAGRLAERTILLDETSVFGGPTELNTFDQNVPGFAVTFLLLGMLFGVGLGLLDEREWGTLYRLRASPHPPSSLIVGKMLSRFLAGVIQMMILFAFGYLAFRISLGKSLLALFVVIVATSFAAAAFGLLAASLAPTRDAFLPLGTIAIVAMAAVGGCWWPITIEPPWLQKAAHVFPTAWAMGAFNDLMLRQRSFLDVVPAVLALIAFGSVYLAVGARMSVRWGEVE